ncbi:TPA: hypothetical protein DCX16_01310 [bacterium]|nr:hypothetical protein [bacterium]
MINVFIFLIIAFCVWGKEETAISPSELIIIGEDKFIIEWEEEIPEPELLPFSMPAPEPKTIEKKEEVIEFFTVPKDKTTLIIEEKKPQFSPKRSLPLLFLSFGNRDFLSYGFIWAKEKKKGGGSFLIERESNGGFKENNIVPFHSQSKDRLEAVFGTSFNEARLTIPILYLNKKVFLPYQNRDEERRKVRLKANYSTSLYNNLSFVGFIVNEKKDITKNTRIGTRLSFDFAKRKRLNIDGENEKNRRILSLYLSFLPIKKPFKNRNILIQPDIGLSNFKNKTSMFSPFLDIRFKSLWRKDLILCASIKNHLISPDFSFLYLESPYSTVSSSLKPERVFSVEFEAGLKKEGLLLESSFFISAKNNCLEWCRKSSGLYEPRNRDSCLVVGIKTKANYSLKERIDIEPSVSITGYSKKMNYKPSIEGELVLRYKKGTLLITPSLVITGSQKADSERIGSSCILNIKAEKKISDEFEAFLKIENLFNQKYKEREDYFGKKLFATIGLKIRL